MKPCYKCGNSVDTILVTYPDGDKWTCKDCLKRYQSKLKKAFEV